MNRLLALIILVKITTPRERQGLAGDAIRHDIVFGIDASADMSHLLCTVKLLHKI